MRCHWNPIPAGFEGHGGCVGPGRGMLNNAERPPVFAEEGGEELYAGGPLVHFNEVDECAGADAIVTNRCWKALGSTPRRRCTMCGGASTTKARGPAA